MTFSIGLRGCGERGVWGVPLVLRQKIGRLQQSLSRQLGFEHGKKGEPGCPWWADRQVYREAYLLGMGPSPEAPNTHDYYSLITRAVAALNNNTRDTRQALYNRARIAQTARLNNIDPALSMAEMSSECEALEHAIRVVEVEATTGTRATPPAFVAERKVRRSNVNPPGGGRIKRKQMERTVERGSIVRLREHLQHRDQG